MLNVRQRTDSSFGESLQDQPFYISGFDTSKHLANSSSLSIEIGKYKLVYPEYSE
jgi:hypothetical protein